MLSGCLPATLTPLQAAAVETQTDKTRVTLWDQMGEPVEKPAYAASSFPQVLVPTQTLGHRLIATRISVPNPNQIKAAASKGAPRPYTQLVLIYTGGLEIDQRDMAKAPDFADSVAAAKKAQAAGALATDKLPTLVDINGSPGAAIEPGVTKYKDGGQKARPSQVSWFANGALYTIIGDQSPVADLLVIARSMKRP
jgi:hypothetical protein